MPREGGAPSNPCVSGGTYAVPKPKVRVTGTPAFAGDDSNEI
jgi:hypothetical protein